MKHLSWLTRLKTYLHRGGRFLSRVDLRYSLLALLLAVILWFFAK